MTTFFNFTPAVTSAFQFQPTLDGQVYTATIVWSLFGQRYYLKLTDLSGNLIVYEALAGSDTGVNISTLTWSQGQVTLTTAAPHGYDIGSVIDLTVSGCAPDGYNGTFLCQITGPNTLTYALAANPGVATGFGALTYDISLVSGYFTSTLVFRQPNMQFEVSP
jgi:hypothetical protein